MKTFNNAFELITDVAGAKLMLEKSNLMDDIVDNIKRLGLTQKAAAKIMKVTQPRISNLVKGKISKFSLDYLFLMTERLRLYALAIGR